MQRPGAVWVVILLLVLNGCASYRTVSGARPGGPKVYSGLRMDCGLMLST